MNNEPKNYRVVNRLLVEDLARGMGISLGTSVKSETEFGLTKVVTARSKRMKSEPMRTPDDPAIIADVVEGLRNAGKLRIERPQHPREYWFGDASQYYVWEETVLTPVRLFNRNREPREHGFPSALTVWISDPPAKTALDPWDFTTCFLFLVEELREHRSADGWFISGISALRLVAEFIGKWHPDPSRELARLAQSEDRFGRFSPEHPIEKLRRIGGTVGTPRRAEVVYKIAYATDEQAHTVDGVPQRVGDVLGYPLYIA